MNKKEINEIRRRFKKDACNFDRIAGCYVNADKEIVTTFSKTFLNCDDNELFKYLDIAKKSMSGKVGDNLLTLSFDTESGQNPELMALRDSRLMNEEMLISFYEQVINTYDHVGNYLILLFHDTYDIPVKTTDDLKLNESEEVYEYIIGAILPVNLSDAALGYIQEENAIGPQVQNWIVKPLDTAFVFPAFNDRSTDLNQALVYTKNTKEPHFEFFNNCLSLATQKTATMKKNAFNNILTAALGEDVEKNEDQYFDIEKDISDIIESNARENVPVVLNSEDLTNILKKNTTLSDAKVEKASSDFDKYFEEEEPLAQDIVDEKLLKRSDLLMKIKTLKEQVVSLTAEVAALKEQIN